MLHILVSITLVTTILLILRFIDARIKGSNSILHKIISVSVVFVFLATFIYFYGETILNSLNVNLKSFTNIKEFLARCIILVFALMILFILVHVKMASHPLSLKKEGIKTIESNDKIADSIVFDINTIPNIASNFSHALMNKSIDYIDGFSLLNIRKESY